MFIGESNEDNSIKNENLNLIENEDTEECLYSSISPLKTKGFNTINKGCLELENSKDISISGLPEKIKKISFRTYSKETQHDYYSISAECFELDESIGKSTKSLNHLDKMRESKIKQPVKYKNKFFSLNNKMRIKFKNKLINFNNKRLTMERLIRKNGEVNINRVNIASRHRKYINDLFNTIIGKFLGFFIKINIL